MSLVRINWRPNVSERRKFGAVMLIGFGIISVLLAWKGSRTAALWAAVIAVAAGALGLSGTAAAMPVYWLWMALAFVLGSIMSRLILSIFYYIILTPVALIMRAAGRDKLGLKEKQESYWKDIPDRPSSYERQF
jgi:hypothetical protein